MAAYMGIRIRKSFKQRRNGYFRLPLDASYQESSTATNPCIIVIKQGDQGGHSEFFITRHLPKPPNDRHPDCAIRMTQCLQNHWVRLWSNGYQGSSGIYCDIGVI